jgi:hypothetical protein
MERSPPEAANASILSKLTSQSARHEVDQVCQKLAEQQRQIEVAAEQNAASPSRDRTSRGRKSLHGSPNYFSGILS